MLGTESAGAADVWGAIPYGRAALFPLGRINLHTSNNLELEYVHPIDYDLDPDPD